MCLYPLSIEYILITYKWGICDTKFLVMLWHSGAAKFSKLEVHNITLIEQLTVLLEYINVSISGTGHTKTFRNGRAYKLDGHILSIQPYPLTMPLHCSV